VLDFESQYNKNGSAQLNKMLYPQINKLSQDVIAILNKEN